MKDYREFTFGWLIFAIVIPIHFLLTYLYFNNIGDRPMSTNVYVVITVGLALTYILFYGLTTKVTAEKIIVSFGPGIIKKRIPLKTIKSVDPVKSPWYYGWGIRIIPNGVLHNISGRDGVELRFNDHKGIIRIGTKNSLMLKNEIEKRLV
jgi:hypothetical protein